MAKSRIEKYILYLFQYFIKNCNAGFELEKYNAFNYNLSQKYPVVSRIGVMDTEGNICSDGGEDNESLK